MKALKSPGEKVGGIMSGREDKVGSGIKDSLEELSHENEVQQSGRKSLRPAILVV